MFTKHWTAHLVLQTTPNLVLNDLGPLLLIWINFNFSVVHMISKEWEWNWLSIPKLSRFHRWSWEWISNFTPHFIIDVIIYPCWDYSQFMLINGPPVNNSSHLILIYLCRLRFEFRTTPNALQITKSISVKTQIMCFVSCCCFPCMCEIQHYRYKNRVWTRKWGRVYFFTYELSKNEYH